MASPGNLLLVPRNPQEEDQRTRHFIDVVQALLNPLVLNGQILQIPGTPGSGTNFGIIGLWYDGVGPPAATLGTTNDYYLDTASGKLYKKLP